MITFFKRSLYLLILTIVFTSHASAMMRITEYMYSGIDGEFVEFTNFGVSPVSMTGWSFSDEDRIVGDFDLSAFGTVEPGESVILTESPAEAFRTAWGLAPTAAIIGELGVSAGSNMGRSDEINLYNNTGTLVDRLTYSDEGTLVDRLTYSDENFPGTPRANLISAWVTSGGLGLNDPSQWALSVPDDDQSSWPSEGGDVGNPASHQDASLPPVPLPLPVVSQPGGMYNAPVTVGLSTTTPGSVIRYTLDWSVLSAQAILYPILLHRPAMSLGPGNRPPARCSRPTSSAPVCSKAVKSPVRLSRAHTSLIRQ
ncbi:MAG: lamin tail domain-containing protein [Planctomycetota bacterium]